MNLQLSLTTQWFLMTKSGEKTEDYREITHRYCNRFILVNGKKRSIKDWEKSMSLTNFHKWSMDRFMEGLYTFDPFTTNTMTLGYPKKGDPERTLIFEHAGIEIRTGKQEWGAEPDKLYFVIKHGKRIEQ